MGLAFIILGIVAMLLPVWATVATELLAAFLLLLWGAVGLWFAWEVRAAREWRYLGVGFGACFLLGLVFVLFPIAGLEVLTIIMMVAFLMEGVLSILLGLRISVRFDSWGWLVFSGLCSLAVGVVILIGWPETAVWTLGLLLGVNFLSTGFSLVVVGKAAGNTA